MRGKGHNSKILETQNRITPAYAGKSISAKNTSPRFKDHPRLCGEKFEQREQMQISIRITPAYAGKSEPETKLAPWGRDHPRLCGEKCTQERNLFRI